MLATVLVLTLGILGSILAYEIPLLSPFNQTTNHRMNSIQTIIEGYFGNYQYIIWAILFALRMIIFKIVNNVFLEITFKSIS